MNNLNESGRSMVEMLGVLAIIGVLSIGGIAGYTQAMKKYRANEAVNKITMAAVLCGTEQKSAAEAVGNANDSFVTAIACATDGTVTYTLNSSVDEEQVADLLKAAKSGTLNKNAKTFNAITETAS